MDKVCQAEASNTKTDSMTVRGHSENCWSTEVRIAEFPDVSLEERDLDTSGYSIF